MVEEIVIRAVEDSRAAGGEELRLIPCVAAHSEWVRGVAAAAHENLPIAR